MYNAKETYIIKSQEWGSGGQDFKISPNSGQGFLNQLEDQDLGLRLINANSFLEYHHLSNTPFEATKEYNEILSMHSKLLLCIRNGQNDEEIKRQFDSLTYHKYLTIHKGLNQQVRNTIKLP